MKATWLIRGGLVGVALWAAHLQFQSNQTLRERERENRRKTTEVGGHSENAHRTIAEIAGLGQQAAAARGGLDRWSQERRTGPTVVWFPGWLKAQLRRSGIAEAQIRLNTEVPEPGLPGFKRTCWNVNLPPQDGMPSMSAALLAVKEIEQRDRFVKILDSSFRANPEEPDRPVGVFNVEVLVPE